MQHLQWCGSPKLKSSRNRHITLYRGAFHVNNSPSILGRSTFQAVRIGCIHDDYIHHSTRTASIHYNNLNYIYYKLHFQHYSHNRKIQRRCLILHPPHLLVVVSGARPNTRRRRRCSPDAKRVYRRPVARCSLLGSGSVGWLGIGTCSSGR